MSASHLPNFKVGSEVRYQLSEVMALWEVKYSVRRMGNTAAKK
jgi:hypothetical protein